LASSKTSSLSVKGMGISPPSESVGSVAGVVGSGLGSVDGTGLATGGTSAAAAVVGTADVNIDRTIDAVRRPEIRRVLRPSCIPR